MKVKIFNSWDILIILIFSLWIGFSIGGIILDNDKKIDKGYKQGQIDALNGIQNYDQIIKQDTIYIKIK